MAKPCILGLPETPGVPLAKGPLFSVASLLWSGFSPSQADNAFGVHLNTSHDYLPVSLLNTLISNIIHRDNENHQTEPSSTLATNRD